MAHVEAVLQAKGIFVKQTPVGPGEEETVSAYRATYATEMAILEQSKAQIKD